MHHSYRLSWFTWILFLDSSKPNIFHIDKIIPFNCEFIVVQEIQDNIYKLTEVYGLRNKAFTFDFGTWNDGLLRISNLSFYWRRLNLNETVITAVGFQEAQIVHFIRFILGVGCVAQKYLFETFRKFFREESCYFCFSNMFENFR